MVLPALRQIRVSGAQGHVVEYTVDAVRDVSMEGRMTICNMSIEAGARAGLIAPDDLTFAYMEGRRCAPGSFDHLRDLRTDPGAEFDRTVTVDVSSLKPQVTWGTSPGMVAAVDGVVPDPAELDDPAERDAAERALQYMALEPRTPLAEIRIDKGFIGSRANARVEGP